jgi:RNA polymerase sigma factor (TIGR02999 family)
MVTPSPISSPQPPPPALDAVYRELRVVARNLLAREPYDHTLESCELVHLAWARLLNGDLSALARDEPRQVIALAVTNMRRELVDHARRRRAAKRPDAKIRVDFDDAPLFCRTDPHTFLAVDALLDRLAAGEGRVRNGERRAECARYALYGGLSESEISEVLGLPKSTVGSDVRFVKAWLAARLADA